MKNAKCKCGLNVRWDWNNDAYVVGDDGKEAYANECMLQDPNGTPDSEVALTVMTCICGRVLGASRDDEDGLTIHNNLDFINVNWEDEENSY